jgi:hypothetical protein
MYNFLKKKEESVMYIKKLAKDFISLIAILFVLNIFVESRINDKMVEYGLKKTDETTSVVKSIFHFVFG